MSTTNQLPEPELGYIKTDKSNQPAFSARQMREAMEQARAILARRPEPVPMTDDEATAMIRETVRSNAILRGGSTSLKVVRAVEAHHGIAAQSKKEKP